MELLQQISEESKTFIREVSGSSWRSVRFVDEPSPVATRREGATSSRALCIGCDREIWIHPSVVDLAPKIEAKSFVFNHRPISGATTPIPLSDDFARTPKIASIHSLRSGSRLVATGETTFYRFDGGVSFRNPFGVFIVAAHESWPIQLHHWFFLKPIDVADVLGGEGFVSRDVGGGIAW